MGLFKTNLKILKQNLHVYFMVLLVSLLIYVNYDWLYNYVGSAHMTSLKIIIQLCMLVVIVAVALQIWFTTKFLLVNKNVHMGALFFTLSLFQTMCVMTYSGMPYSHYAGLAAFFSILTHNLLPLGMIVIFSIRYRIISAVYRKKVFGASILVAAFFIICAWQMKDIIGGIFTSNIAFVLQIVAVVIQIVLIVLLMNYLKLSRNKNMLLLMTAVSYLASNILYVISSGDESATYFICGVLQVVAYITLFRAIYYSSAEKPYRDLERSELHMQKMAYFDEETGLPNYRYLEERVQNSFNFTNRKYALIILEIERTDALKASFGQKGTDQIVNTIVKRWQEAIQDEMLVRFSRNQFLIFVKAYSPQKLESILENVKQALDEPIEWKHVSLRMQFTSGIAFFPMHATSLDHLMTCVHLAHHEAKQNNLQVVEYSIEMDLSNREKAQLQYDLEYAIDNDEFYLEYQPQYDLSSRKIESVEALVRWNHPEHGVIAPHRFITLAEETGLIVPLGIYVLRRACLEIKHWQEVYEQSLKVAVNLSLSQLYADNFVDEVQKILKETQLDPLHLQLEITESVTSESQQIIPILNKLKEMNITLAVDDFGTGYSSLSYLADLPIDCVKVDRAFVNKIGISDKGEALVKTILAMAESLHLGVVAEGIETLEQLKYLEKIGCQKIQGYYISRPLAYKQLLQHYVELTENLCEII